MHNVCHSLMPSVYPPSKKKSCQTFYFAWKIIIIIVWSLCLFHLCFILYRLYQNVLASLAIISIRMDFLEVDMSQ